MKYKSVVNLKHCNGETIIITCECGDARLTAHVANSIRELYKPAATLQQDCQLERERMTWDFLRDFFHLPRRHSKGSP
jgi:hypothetical protein